MCCHSFIVMFFLFNLYSLEGYLFNMFLFGGMCFICGPQRAIVGFIDFALMSYFYYTVVQSFICVFIF